MKLDFDKPHGVVFGHAYAAYEQDGILYDGAGERIDKPEVKEEVETSGQEDAINYQARQAKDFLLGILKEGPVTRTAIYRECEANNQNWEEVQKAFADIGGEAVRIKNGIFWKLKSE